LTLPLLKWCQRIEAVLGKTTAGLRLGIAALLSVATAFVRAWMLCPNLRFSVL
jgi:hypothetical protein